MCVLLNWILSDEFHQIIVIAVDAKDGNWYDKPLTIQSTHKRHNVVVDDVFAHEFCHEIVRSNIIISHVNNTAQLYCTCLLAVYPYAAHMYTTDLACEERIASESGLQLFIEQTIRCHCFTISFLFVFVVCKVSKTNGETIQSM